MPSKEIFELRRSGRLEEALEKINGVLTSEPDNIWNKKAAAWVFFDYLKKYSTPGSYDLFKEYLLRINELQLPEDEKMIFDCCGGKTGAFVFELYKSEPLNLCKIDELFKIVRDFHFTKPSDTYSFLYKAFHRSYHKSPQYIDFADWWNFDNFRPEDFVESEYEGRKIISVAEQAYIAYSKKLLEGGNDQTGRHVKTDRNRIREFMPRLDKVIEEHPECQYPPYYKAKLLLELGDKDDVLSTFLPFARQKKNNFWVWELLTDLYSDDELKFVCYCKALSLPTADDYLVNLLQKFASMLIGREMYAEAKSEIERVVAARSKNKWNIPPLVFGWTTGEWFKTTEATKHNRDLYAKHVRQAENLLFGDIPEETVVVELVNENKNTLRFIKDKTMFGSFRYAGVIKKPRVGDILKVRFKGTAEKGFYRVWTVRPYADASLPGIMKIFDGTVKIAQAQNFGFVENIFVNPELVQKNNLKNGHKVKGKAMLSFNIKKQMWGLKAIEISNKQKINGF